MIICSCAVISDKDIDRAVGWMRAADPQALITPGKVYRALGKRPVCGGCAPRFVTRMHDAARIDVPDELRGLRGGMKGERTDEGRPEGHRLSQQGVAS